MYMKKCPHFNSTPSSPAQEAFFWQKLLIFLIVKSPSTKKGFKPKLLVFLYASYISLAQFNTFFPCSALPGTTLPCTIDCYGNHRNQEGDVNVYIHEEEYLGYRLSQVVPNKGVCFISDV